MSMAEGVIVAKARSMHGEALSEEMYQELLHKKSVAEIAGYLKHETSYAAALKDVRENNIHRGQLESILRQEIFKKTMKLYRYADAARKPYYRLHMQQIEIDLILSRIRVLISREYEAAIAEFPIFLKSYTSFDLLRLGNVHSYDELLDVLKHTMYYAVLLPYRVKKGEENDIDYTKIETQLQMQHYTHTFQVIDKTLKGKSRKAVKQYFATQIELSNIEKIYRYKKYFNAREDVIRESLVPVHEHLSAAFVEELIAQPNARAFICKAARIVWELRIWRRIMYISNTIPIPFCMHWQRRISIILSMPPWYIPAICIPQSVSWKISSILLKVCVIMYPLRIWSAC